MSLKILDLNPWRVLVIAAHPGDIERGAAAAVAKWTDGGAEVIYLVATRGELSIPGIDPEEAALVRSAEQSAAASVAGVNAVDFLDVDDGTVEATISLRRAIVRDIRHFRPDVVMVINHHEYEPDGTRNDADHRAVGTAALDAVIASANQWAFRDVNEPHTVDTVLVASSPTATHVIDVSKFDSIALDARAAHHQQLAAIEGHPAANESLLMTTLQSAASEIEGITAGLPVEVVEYGQGPACHSFVIKEYVDLEGHARVSKMTRKTRAAKPDRSQQTKNDRSNTNKSKRGAKKSQPTSNNQMKIKVRLEQRGRLQGIEIPDSVMQRLGDAASAGVTVNVNETTFDSSIRSTDGKPFVAINAERRKAAGIAIEDTFFVALVPKK